MKEYRHPQIITVRKKQPIYTMDPNPTAKWITDLYIFHFDKYDPEWLWWNNTI